MFSPSKSSHFWTRCLDMWWQDLRSVDEWSEEVLTELDAADQAFQPKKPKDRGSLAFSGVLNLWPKEISV